MREKVFVLLCLFLSGLIYAGQSKISVKDYDKIELCFENIVIDDIEFSGKSDIKIYSDSEDDVTIKKENGKIFISAAEEETKIDIILPKNKTYTYILQESEKDTRCQFTQDEFNLFEEDIKVVIYKDGVLLIKDKENHSVIKVDDDKIYIRNEDGTETEISSKGIISSDDDSDDHLDGFFGKILGNAIQFGAHLALSRIGDSPETMAKFFINSDLDEDMNIHITFD